MAKSDTVFSFDQVTFEYGPNNPILQNADFSVRRGSKITLMGQNGAGKSTIFALITGTLTPESGTVSIAEGATIATARQVIPREEIDTTVEEFFASVFPKKIYDKIVAKS